MDDEDDLTESRGNEILPSHARAGRVVDPKHEAQLYTQFAIQTLVTVCEKGGARDKVAAAVAILDRGWGKPASEVDESSKRVDESANLARPDFSRLSPEEQRTVFELVKKARGEAS